MSAYEVSCKEAGAACRTRTKADTEEDFKEKLTAHLRKKHHAEPNATLVDYLMTIAEVKSTEGR